MAILIDNSNDMDKRDFKELINFASEVIKHLPFSPGLPSITIVTTGSTVERVVGPEDLNNRENVLLKLRKIRQVTLRCQIHVGGWQVEKHFIN